jgi:hypothetical protein
MKKLGFMNKLSPYAQNQALWTKSGLMNKIRFYEKIQGLWTKSGFLNKMSVYGKNIMQQSYYKQKHRPVAD